MAGLAAICWRPGPAGAQETARFSRSAPAGFEDAAVARRMDVPIVFDGAVLGTASATVDLETITFDDPGAVAALAPGILDRGKVADALTGPLPLRAGLACGDAPRPGCGRYTPERAAVVFDRALGEAHLFVNPSLRGWAAAAERMRPQGAAPALIGRLDLGFSGQSEAGDPAYSAAFRGTAGAGPTHLRLQAFAGNGGGEIDQLYLRRVSDGRDAIAGLFQLDVASFLPPERLLGVRLGHTLDDLPSAAASYDTPLVVSLASPATIDVFAGDRLIGSRRYEAGEARIDTSTFPSGAYVVRLVIREGGAERTEERFFSRETGYPPRGAAQSFVAVGVRRLAPGFDKAGFDHDQLQLQAGHRRRLTDRLGAGATLYVREETAAAEVGFALAGAGLRWSGSALASTAGESAYGLAVRAQLAEWRMSGDVRRLEGRRAPGAPAEPGAFLGVSEDFWQGSLSAGRALGRLQYQAIGFWRDGAASGESWSVLQSVERPVRLVRGALHLRLSGELGPEDYGAVRLEATFSGSPRRGASATARAGAGWRREQDGSETKPIYEARAAQRWDLAPDADLSASVGWRRDMDKEQLVASTALRTAAGGGGLTVQSEEGGGRTLYFGRAETGFAVTGHGLALGAGEPGDAAVVYVNASTAEDAHADALLSGARVGELGPGDQRVRAVPAFQSYTVDMLPANGAPLAGDARGVQATVFPGTAAILAARFVRTTTVFGQLVDADGAPIAGATLTASRSAGGSDDQGYFQVDIVGAETVDVQRRDGRSCALDLAAPLGAPSFADVGLVVCR